MNFLQRHVKALTAITCLSLLMTFVMGVLLLGTQEYQLQRFDRPALGLDKLPGRNGQLSDRSKTEFDVLLRKNEAIVGGWVSKLNYDRFENPIIISASKDEKLSQIIEEFVRSHESGQSKSSVEIVDENPREASKDMEDARAGLVKCWSLSPNFGMAGIDKVGKGICRATIPPFDENVSMAIVVIVNVDASTNTPDVREVRRVLLQLQIDIFNRDFQGRETWAHP